MEASRRVMRMPTHTDSGSRGSQSQLELNLDTALQHMSHRNANLNASIVNMYRWLPMFWCLT